MRSRLAFFVVCTIAVLSILCFCSAIMVMKMSYEAIKDLEERDASLQSVLLEKSENHSNPKDSMLNQAINNQIKNKNKTLFDQGSELSYHHQEIESFEEFWKKDNDSSNNELEIIELKRKHTAPPESKWLRGTIKEISGNTYNSTSNTATIPKIVNKVYIEKAGLFPTNEEMKNMGTLMEAHLSWSIHNPDYEIRYFNLNSCRQYLHEHFHPVFLRAFDCIEAFSGKVNFFRMLVVYAEGGWYSDWKQTCLEPNLLDNLGKDVDFFGVWDHGTYYLKTDKCIQNCFFGAVPRHPLIAEMLQMILSNVRDEVYGKHVLYTTGPCLFGQTFAKYTQEQNPDMERIRMGYFIGYKFQIFGWTYITLDDDERGVRYIRHKCEGCGQSQRWLKGNSYVRIYYKGMYYCQDAKSLFSTAVVNVNNGDLLQ